MTSLYSMQLHGVSRYLVTQYIASSPTVVAYQSLSFAHNATKVVSKTDNAMPVMGYLFDAFNKALWSRASLVPLHITSLNSTPCWKADDLSIPHAAA